MRSSLSILLALSALCLFSTPVQAAERVVTIDPEQSTLTWIGRKITGQHDGTVGIKQGEVKLEGDQIVGGSFEIDMSTIVVNDVKNPKDNKKLRDHLSSDDFFSVAKFPSATFTITEVTPIENPAAEGATHLVTGELSIKGISHPITIPARIEIGVDQARAAGEVAVDRTLWNVRYGSGKFFENLGDRMIYDDFTVGVKLVGRIG